MHIPDDAVVLNGLIERTDLLKEDELGDLGINLHAFLINIHGLPDNLACGYLLDPGIYLKPQRIGLFNTQFTQPLLPRAVRDY